MPCPLARTGHPTHPKAARGFFILGDRMTIESKTASDFLKEAASDLARREAEAFTEHVEAALEDLETYGTPIISPVEQLFFIEWEYQGWGQEDHPPLIPQYKKEEETGEYRIDFVVDFFCHVVMGSSRRIIHGNEKEIHHAIPVPLLGIEIDGHIWHEKTKKQVEYHKKRERFLVSRGWRLLRFSGSEVFKSPWKCFSESYKIEQDMEKSYRDLVFEFCKTMESNNG